MTIDRVTLRVLIEKGPVRDAHVGFGHSDEVALLSHPHVCSRCRTASGRTGGSPNASALRCRPVILSGVLPAVSWRRGAIDLCLGGWVSIGLLSNPVLRG